MIKKSVLRTIKRCFQYTRKNKEAVKVIVTGCMVQSHSTQITEHYPEVDYLLGSGNVEGIDLVGKALYRT